MADSDFVIRGNNGAFASHATLAFPLAHLDARVYFNNMRPNALAPAVGHGLMIDDEIMGITAVGPNYMDVKRGCYDTIPAPHALNADVWFWRLAVTSDQHTYANGESASVKVLPYTPSGARVSVASSPPRNVTFQGRFIRPYPPGDFQIDGQPWYETTAVDLDGPSLVLTWTHRDRVLQADQFLGHDEASVGPEVGTTYFLRGYRADDLVTPIFTSDPISGDDYTYTMAQLIEDMRLHSLDTSEIVLYFHSERDGFESLYGYPIPLTITQPEDLGYRLGEAL